MKKILLLGLLLWTFGCMAQFKVPGKILPHSYVQDYEHVLSSDQVLKLNQQIDTLTHHFSAQVAVIILNDLQGYEIEEATLAFGREWGVGLKDTNNGIVYLIAPNLHKARLEVGYGLEGNIPDITAAHISDESTHFYKVGNWYAGISQVLMKVQQQLDKKPEEVKGVNVWGTMIVCVVVLGLVLFLFFLFNKDKNEEPEEELRFSPPPPFSNDGTIAAGAAVGTASSSKDDEEEEKRIFENDDDSGGSSFGSFGSSGDSGSDFGNFGGGSFGGGGATSTW